MHHPILSDERKKKGENGSVVLFVLCCGVKFPVFV